MSHLIYNCLLSVHIAAGCIALVAMLVAVLTRKGGPRHRRAGRVFVYGMAGIFATALFIQVLRPNLFLTLIAIFSFYVAATGWQRARNRSGVATPAEWLGAVAMGLFAIVMLGYGARLAALGDNMGIVLICFGGIGGALAAGELWALRRRAYVGTYRIAAHLTRMLSGAIATVTAVAVVNIDLAEHNWLVWLAPTVLFTPLIVYWNVRLRATPHPAAKAAGSL